VLPGLSARSRNTGLSLVGSTLVYCGLVLTLFGLTFIRRPIGLATTVAGVGLVVIGMLLPAPESRVSPPRTRLDEFSPAWQFRERHSRVVHAPPARVFDAIKRIRADEILFFRTLTWIRRGGRRVPESVLNAGERTPIVDVATRTTFVRLADDPPRELVVGTIVAAPPGAPRQATPEIFLRPPGPGFALATMNFLVTPVGTADSRVSTETRVYATSDAVRRRFAMYWRIIYPGSALIRRMWLRAIKRRAESVTG
jgi:hypothetical protein